MPPRTQKTTPIEETGTRERILAAAAPLFAREGFEATGVRAIAAAGGVNIAAVNYHFGSKDSLLLAIAERHTQQVNERRCEALALVLEDAEKQGVRPEVHKIVEAFVGPSIRFLSTENRENFLLMRLILARVRNDPTQLGRVIIDSMRPTVLAFVSALKIALPNAKDSALHEGIHITMGAFLQSMTCDDILLQLCPEIDRSPEAIIRSLVRYCGDGIHALSRE